MRFEAESSRRTAHGVCTAALGIMAMVAAGCAGDRVTNPEPPPPPVTVTISPSSATVAVNATTQFIASVQNGASPVVVWHSSDPTVAIVDGSGRVTGVRAGSAIVSATAVADNAASASASITVTAPPPPTCGSGIGTLIVPMTVSGSLAPSDCRLADGSYYDVWQFTLGSQSSIVIDLGSAAFDSFLALLDAGANSVAADDDSGDGLDARIATILPAGTYQIVATSVEPGHTGPYSLSVQGGGSHGGTVDIVVTNSLHNTVNITVNGIALGTVPPRSTRQAQVQRTGSVTMSWSLVRSATTSGVPVGDVISGNFAPVTNPGERINYTIDAVLGETYIFRPVIINQTATTLLMGVNEGLQRQNRCNCTVPPNSTGTAIGYYLLFSNSNVRAYRDGSAYSGSYTYWVDFAGLVDNTTGDVRLTATIPPAAGMAAAGVQVAAADAQAGSPAPTSDVLDDFAPASHDIAPKSPDSPHQGFRPGTALLRIPKLSK